MANRRERLEQSLVMGQTISFEGSVPVVWEQLDPRVSRFRVPKGWIYCVVTKVDGHNVTAATFVPR